MITLGLIAQLIGSALLLGGYFPQIFKLHKTKNPTGISVLFWLMIATGCTLIFANMNIKDVSLEIQFTQALNALFAWYTLAIVIYFKRKRSEEIKIHKDVTGAMLFLTAFSIGYIHSNDISLIEIGEALQIFGTVALLVAYLPQIFHLYKVKDATGLSKWLFIVLGSGLLCVTLNMVITQTSIGIILTELVNISLIFVLYIMTGYYQSKTLNKSIDIGSNKA